MNDTQQTQSSDISPSISCFPPGSLDSLPPAPDSCYATCDVMKPETPRLYGARIAPVSFLRIPMVKGCESCERYVGIIEIVVDVCVIIRCGGDVTVMSCQLRVSPAPCPRVTMAAHCQVSSFPHCDMISDWSKQMD